MRQKKNFRLFIEIRNESLKERPLSNQIRFITKLDRTFQAGQEAIVPAYSLDEKRIIVNENKNQS